MSKFSELVKRTIKWSEGIDLYNQSTERKQVSKAFEEFAELIAALDDNDEYEIKDAIGDILVCVVNADYIDSNGRSTVFEPKMEFDSQTLNLSELAQLLIIRDHCGCVYSIYRLCDHLKLNPTECFEMAVETIEKRKLLMVNGKAVKWENMTDEQRDIWRSRNEI